MITMWTSTGGNCASRVSGERVRSAGELNVRTMLSVTTTIRRVTSVLVLDHSARSTNVSWWWNPSPQASDPPVLLDNSA